MERPVSAASSHGGHRHGLSASLKVSSIQGTAIAAPVTMQDTPTAALFVNNLRLLDFDLLPDWPGITSTTFGHNDARARIRGAEFALFQLFRLYDPMTTSEKLQPFFPPLEPLQSINLRAALYRCLNELKKNGVLGREIILRKSMLDDCQGDKFLELCLSFSATVLRKMTLARNTRRPLAEQIGLAQYISKSDAETMLPLAIAHKGVLNKMLRQRQKKHETYVNLYNVLIQKEAELQQRKAHAQEYARKRPFITGIDKIDAVERVALQNRSDHEALYHSLVSGDDRSSSDSLLTRCFDDLWLDNARDISPQIHTKDSFLESLQSRATQQSQRLQKWRRVHEKLASDKDRDEKQRAPQSVPVGPSARFDQHKQINVRDDVGSFIYVPRNDIHSKAARYDEILTAMREELRQSRHRSAPGAPLVSQPIPPLPVREPSPTTDASSTVQARDLRPASHTAVPVRPNMFGRRVSSRSRSYQQPKVDSQRQPIPLKSEIFSPIKTQRNSISPTSAATSMLPSPAEGVEFTGFGTSGLNNGRSLSIGSGLMLSTNNDMPLERDHTIDGDDDRPLAVHARPSSVSGPLTNISLAERTRLSMARIGTVRGTTSRPDISDSKFDEPCDLDAGGEEEVGLDSPTTRSSLAERTRQSLLLAPRPSPRATIAHDNIARKPAYPADSFETPVKARNDSGKDEGNEASLPIGRSVTPREQLFSPEAEYDSVFKARPKVALSPVVAAQKRPDSGCVSLDLSDALPHRATMEV